MAFQSAEMRQIIFMAAAREILPQKYAKLTEAILHVLKRCADQRHKLAHGLWGVSPIAGAGDILLLVDPKRHWENIAAGAKPWRRRKSRGKGFDEASVRAPTLSSDFMFAYDSAELQGILRKDGTWLSTRANDGGHQRPDSRQEFNPRRPARPLEVARPRLRRALVRRSPPRGQIRTFCAARECDR
jgi:hypothetical protein